MAHFGIGLFVSVVGGVVLSTMYIPLYYLMVLKNFLFYQNVAEKAHPLSQALGPFLSVV